MLKKKNEEEIQGMKKTNQEEIVAWKRENARIKQKLNGDPIVQKTIEGGRRQTKNIHLRTKEVGSSYKENTLLYQQAPWVRHLDRVLL